MVSYSVPIRAAQEFFVWATHGPKQIFSDFDATGDFLDLIQTTHKITALVGTILPLKLISEGVSSVVEFFRAKNIIASIHDLISGTEIWENPFGPNIPNVFKVVSSTSFLIGNMSSFVSWLSSIKLLGSWVNTATARIVTWGKPFVIVDGIGDATTIVGSVFSLFDTCRLLAAESMDTTAHPKALSKRIDRIMDIAMDVSSIASSILGNIPGISVVYSLVVSGIGSLVSLGSFFKREYYDSPRKEGVI